MSTSKFTVAQKVRASAEYLAKHQSKDGPSRLTGLVGTIAEVHYGGGTYEVDFGIPTPKHGRTPSYPTWLLRDDDLEAAE